MKALAAVFLSVALRAQGPSSATEEQLRPVLIFQLAQYVNWPDTRPKPGDALRFCILDNPDLADSLAFIVHGKSIQDRPLAVSKVKFPADLKACHVVFIGISRQKSLRDLFAQWTYPPTLVVGEAEGFAELGGMVNLKVSGGRVTLQINIANTERAGLKVRSQLLNLAQLVGGSAAR